MDWLLDLFGLNKGKATQQAADQNKAVLGQLNTDLTNTINTTDATQRGYLTDSLNRSSLGPNANGILGDILGLNGAEGGANARSMFTEAPGYQYSLDQGEQALMRNRSALGNLGSGGTEIDLMKHGVGMADQGWSSWIDRITGGLDRENVLRGDLATQAGNVGGLRMGVTGDIASGNMAANNQFAGGKEAGQGAIWDMLNNVAGVAGSAFGMGGGFGKTAVPGVGMGSTSPSAKLRYGGGF